VTVQLATLWNSTTPAAPAGKANVTFQTDGGAPIAKASAYYTPPPIGGNIISKSANYNLAVGDGTVLFTAVATGTLPDATTCSGVGFVIKNNVSAGGTVTVATTSAQTIDGQTTWLLVNRWQYISVQSDGANWQIIANN
jgi:hypothetical protein